MAEETVLNPWELRQIGGGAIATRTMDNDEAQERNAVLELDGKSYRWFCLGAGQGEKTAEELKTA